jgi:DNA end-binding protein Ku
VAAEPIRAPEAAEAATVRPMWAGTISFGLVSVPVNLYPAVQRSGVGLRMLAEDGTPLARRYYCPKDEQDVPAEHLIRGYEVEPERYVVVTDEELEALEPRKSRDIDLRRFVDVASIPPLFFERSYYLTPATDSTKAYRLLAATMQHSKRAGIATFVMRDKEYLIAILAERGILRAATMRFADEIRTPGDIGLPAAVEAKSSDIERFEREIRRHSSEKLDLRELRDETTERLIDLIEKKKAARQDVVVAPAGAAPEADEEEVDMLEVIRRSLRVVGVDKETPIREATTRARGTRRAGGRTEPARAKTGRSAKTATRATRKTSRRTTKRTRGRTRAA